MTVFVAAAMIPSTVVVFAISIGILYVAWSASWLAGLLFTLWMLAFAAVVGISVRRRLKQRDDQTKLPK